MYTASVMTFDQRLPLDCSVEMIVSSQKEKNFISSKGNTIIWRIMYHKKDLVENKSNQIVIDLSEGGLKAPSTRGVVYFRIRIAKELS